MWLLKGCECFVFAGQNMITLVHKIHIPLPSQMKKWILCIPLKEQRRQKKSPAVKYNRDP